MSPFRADPAGSAIFSDFDGTLAHVVDDPAAAAPLPGVVDELARLAQEAEAAWAQMNPEGVFPGVSSPGAADVWHRYSQGWLPEELRLPVRQIPSVADFRRPAPRPGWPPRAISSGSS